MEAHWIFGEPRDDFNAELNGKKKCECSILKLKKKIYEVLQKVHSCKYIATEGSVASECSPAALSKQLFCSSRWCLD